MKKVGICGHFGLNKHLLNGQTIKTKTITKELQKILGEEEVSIVDTCKGFKNIFVIFIETFKLFMHCSNVVMFPAHKGILFFTPVFLMFNLIYHRKLHYIVIGGWIDEYLDRHKLLGILLKKFHCIYVETTTVRNRLQKKGFKNIRIMNNFKDLKILSKNDLSKEYYEPYKVCTFSRVMEEKGIKHIINAIKDVNDKLGYEAYTLDIYGPVETQFCEEFEDLVYKNSKYVSYKGVVESNKSVEIIKNYFALVFPTLFFTEGIPGTIIDAYAAGVPVISSRWESFQDVVEDGITGFGYEFGDYVALTKLLIDIIKNPDMLIDCKINALNKAIEFTPQNGIKPLLDQLK